jgi:hypothetical protein
VCSGSKSKVHQCLRRGFVSGIGCFGDALPFSLLSDWTDVMSAVLRGCRLANWPGPAAEESSARVEPTYDL